MSMAAMAENDYKGVVFDLLKSEGWWVIAREVIQPIQAQIESKLREVTPDNVAWASVYAGQIAVIDRIMARIKDLAGEE